MSFPTRPDIYLSRVLHLLSNSLLFSGCVVPYLYDYSQAKAPFLFAICGIISAITGLYNIHILDPKKLKGQANTYRVLVYSKLVVVLACTPLLDRLIGASAPAVRLGCVVFAYLSGSFSRYYREKHTPKQ